MPFPSLQQSFWCVGGRLLEMNEKGECRVKMTKIYYIKCETVNKNSEELVVCHKPIDLCSE